ncbi:sirohydrochlorin chelatase [Saccharopolyspora sp. HNM0983]|uniref:Sirohydrochlorin chelatase n=1 Tax=Saccharopolyspora montiporae TaxID=2781240 RepID=A0A929FZS5_9PSEU|nr:sirohydrochlorin chelatase [Saccharopolyspora sp. HNM0983]MBE9372863.1 sirohydrochlorin chelatase [Saccharopolyspora sp. HNM0983]
MRTAVTTTPDPPLLLVAHGTRDPAGPVVVESIAAAVAERANISVHVAYVDVIGPTVADALRALDGPVVALPAFLASGYHVRTDLPAQIAAAGRTRDVVVSPPLGPDPELARAMLDRLTESGWRPGQNVLVSAAGSSDERALGDVRTAARQLGRLCGQRVLPSFVTTAQPLTEDVCANGNVAFIAPNLLAPGLFHRRLTELPARAVAEPIGAHSRVLDLIVRRYRAGAPRRRSTDARSSEATAPARGDGRRFGDERQEHRKLARQRGMLR